MVTLGFGERGGERRGETLLAGVPEQLRKCSSVSFLHSAVRLIPEFRGISAAMVAATSPSTRNWRGCRQSGIPNEGRRDDRGAEALGFLGLVVWHVWDRSSTTRQRPGGAAALRVAAHGRSRDQPTQFS